MAAPVRAQADADEQARGVRRSNLAAAGLQVAAAVYVIVDALRFPYWDPQTGPGAGFLPMWLGGIWLVVAAGLAWQSRSPLGEESSPVPAGTEGRRLASFIGILVVFAALFEPVGALLSVAAFTAALLWLFENYAWPRALVTGAVISAALYLIFATWLGVPLPRGLL